MAGIALSAIGIAEGVKAWRSNGSWWEWASPTGIDPGLGPIKQPARQILPGEDIPMTPDQGLQTRIFSRFDNVRIGPRNLQTKYIWTIDERGINIGWKLTPFETPRGNIIHTNLSPDGAYIGGEAWFISDSTIIINAGSGRYGDGNPMVTAENFLAAVRMWENLAYKVTAIPFGQR